MTAGKVWQERLMGENIQRLSSGYSLSIDPIGTLVIAPSFWGVNKDNVDLTELALAPESYVGYDIQPEAACSVFKLLMVV